MDSWPSHDAGGRFFFDGNAPRRCEKCNSTSAECQRRYIVSCTFIDDSGQAWVSAFNESALELFGKVDADQLAVYKEVRSRRPVV